MFKKILYTLLYLFFLLTPSESISLIQGGNLSLPKLSFLLLLLAFVVSPSAKRMKSNTFLGLFAVYVVWTFITAVFSINIFDAVLRWISFVLPMYVLLIVINSLAVDDKIIRNIMLSYILGCFIPIVVMMNFMAEGLSSDIERMTALEQDQNELSVMLCIGLSFVFYMLPSTHSKLVKALLILFPVLSLLAVLLTGSRTGFVIYIMVLLLGIFSLGKARMLGVILVLLLAIPFLIPYIPISNIDRILQTHEQLSQGDLTGRGQIWENGLNAFNSMSHYRWLVGIGYDQFPYLYQQSYGILKAPHNTYLATYIEQGVIGIGLLLFTLLAVFKKTVTLCRLNKSFVYMGILVPILVAMMTLGLQTRRWLWIILLLIYKMYQNNSSSYIRSK